MRLLRVLQERTYEPLGATGSETTDARIIVATNKNLDEATRRGTFREDLYYRVNVVRIELPPLRRRKEDIPLLAEQFIARFNRLQRKSVTGLSSEALSLLMGHDWPGNIRELENIIERAFILCPEGQVGIEHLPAELTGRDASVHSKNRLRLSRDVLEAQAIREALEKNRFNRLAAARALGVHKSTLFRKIDRLGIKVPKADRKDSRGIKSH
ncbi:MAG: Transcriptional regulatory protein ZraR [candidate division TA06 bacterium ADurb.Bin417]|uniref:Transcriptional regulatory protein ZraR n=1 Tax=candidate division TA06 bacterium ADurb.Bin417 TaxID=1852828 RepID=A0A1V5M649_UNCT6|nr:MAG: Transcriptional regulatory protein ZraR [candidate division TA06 bacterium ADurb.Bin417]